MRKLFVVPAVAAVLITSLATPAHAAGFTKCDLTDTKISFKIEAPDGFWCLRGTGRAEFTKGGIKQVRTGRHSGAYDFWDHNGYVTTRYFGAWTVHGLDNQTFKSVYVD